MGRALMEHYKGLLMAPVCALFALSGVGELAHNLRLVLTGHHAPGIVVANELDDCGPSGHSCSYVPVVRFVLRGGQTVVIRGTIGTDNPPEYHAGEKVMVYYDPRHPQTAVIGSWGDVWFFPLTQIVLTSFFALAMASPFLRQLRRARAMREAFP